ncbi:hypothetical protein G6321_00042545 [Bradyrhizobium barranii subsp. barranii]|uniref:Uncharacterized protein n=1 Tax=Bradyrhizobium barranii subsp. barranii TaxID=2823807 RepID=A0A7Z0QEA2_9BRAD|nr:hypothetical protein [Bradyrhizobium barranii]UGX92327.1 hypothetical protein G6321_00042545 [Bradyrhizobium barranii subsp. barranii]
MRRANKAVPLARRNPDVYAKQLEIAGPEAWPEFLRAAWQIVAIELRKPDLATRVVIDAVRPANVCARAITARFHATTSGQARDMVLRAAKRISARIKRIPAAARHALDEVARCELDGDANSETIAGFLTACSEVVARFPDAQLAQEIQDELSGWPNAAAAATIDERSERPRIHLVHEFDSMPPFERREVEERLTILLKDSPSGPLALEAFTAIANALKARPHAATRRSIVGLHVTYVSGVAEIWRHSGLEPGRSYLLDKPQHKGRFHRFLELVLRDHLDLDPRRKTVPEDRSEWLIRDEDLKAALTAIRKK